MHLSNGVLKKFYSEAAKQNINSICSFKKFPNGMNTLNTPITNIANNNLFNLNHVRLSNPSLNHNYPLNHANSNVNLVSHKVTASPFEIYINDNINTNIDENSEPLPLTMKLPLPQVEFMNKTSKIAKRKRAKRKSGKNISLRYR